MAKKAEFSIETVKKYIFWVCVPLGLLVSVIVTTIAVASVGSQFETRKGELDNQKTAIERIRGESDHPNADTIADVNDRTTDLKGRVYTAWTILAKDQSERNQWPRVLERAFLDEISRLKFGDEISIDAREVYLNFVDRYLPSLESYVDRRRVQVKNRDGNWVELESQSGEFNYVMLSGGAEEGGSDNLPRGGDDEEMYRITGTVDWPSPETRSVTTHWGRLPKSNEVWFAQEELWVYSALLWVVKTSNTGATGTHNAVVKRIENLLIGQMAAPSLSAQLGMSLGGEGGDGGGGDGGGGEGGGGQVVARTEEEVAVLKKHNRYVNADNEPLPGDAPAPFGEFNRMPLCLRLIVDQRHIPEILVNCANCAMPIEVLRVRINPGATRPFDISNYEAAAGGGGGGGVDGGGGDGGVGYGGGEAARAPSGGGGDVQVAVDGVGGIYGTNAVPIEIYGCINIFNPAIEYSGEQQAQPTE